MERKSRRRCKSSVGASVWEVHGSPWAPAEKRTRGNNDPPPLSRIRSGSDSRPLHTYSLHESVFSDVSFYFTVPVAGDAASFKALSHF